LGGRTIPKLGGEKSLEYGGGIQRMEHLERKKWKDLSRENIYPRRSLEKNLETNKRNNSLRSMDRGRLENHRGGNKYTKKVKIGTRDDLTTT